MKQSEQTLSSRARLSSASRYFSTPRFQMAVERQSIENAFIVWQTAKANTDQCSVVTTRVNTSPVYSATAQNKTEQVDGESRDGVDGSGEDVIMHDDSVKLTGEGEIKPNADEDQLHE